ncbi:DUF4038 domain-containing protein [Paenibacillus antri]|uniref:DUF4038 domain-containing protein n=1 Tax=Paenibacillus antri TaxID=2582848 RepID=A0A5R9G777_9BACL|nr:DUF4038 domain-containing protein [Paenibacillus antri]TLS50929.1 DUF4038 domain-containing protein [Paenibacillus antri]
MSKVAIAENKLTLTRDGKPFFYLADTVWSVFSNAEESEWLEYLRYRKAQGFNALQISVLPVLHDASDTYTGSYPYELAEDGTWDFYRINDAFFDRAERMVRAAFDMGFVPALVVLWNTYVPGAWANKQVTGYSMPKETVEMYTEYVVRRFAPYDPIYFISGDTKFETDEINEYFMIAMKKLKSLRPDALTALHPVGNFHELPETFLSSEHLDLYIYQSGHNLQDQHMTYSLAESFRSKPVRRPVINSEPCYEGHGHGGRYGRFDAFDLRKAFWSSVLAGANAGFAYGAHGVWSWHREGAGFTSEGWSKVPFHWLTALRFQGAWDVGYAKSLLETHGLQELEPRNDLLLTPYPDIRVAVSADLRKIAIYAPYSNRIQVALDLTGYAGQAIALKDRSAMPTDVSSVDGGSEIAMLQANSDALYLFTR